MYTCVYRCTCRGHRSKFSIIFLYYSPSCVLRQGLSLNRTWSAQTLLGWWPMSFKDPPVSVSADTLTTLAFYGMLRIQTQALNSHSKYFTCWTIFWALRALSQVVQKNKGKSALNTTSLTWSEAVDLPWDGDVGSFKNELPSPIHVRALQASAGMTKVLLHVASPVSPERSRMGGEAEAFTPLLLLLTFPVSPAVCEWVVVCGILQLSIWFLCSLCLYLWILWKLLMVILYQYDGVPDLLLH